MADLVTNFAEMGANGPSYSSDTTHKTEWFFDLDAELASGKDVAYIDYDKSGVRTGIYETTLGKEVYINGSDFYQVKNGIQLYNTGTSYIYGVEFNDLESPDIYGGAYRIGGGSTSPTIGITYIKNTFGDAKEAPLTSYSTSNNDFIAVERNSAPVYMQYATAKNFSDAIIDNKSKIYIMNATFEDAYRVLRAHDGAEIIIVNSIISAADGKTLLWLGGPNAKISYYNVTWNGLDHPDPSVIGYYGGLTATTVMSRIVKLTENPLPAMSSFFENEIATVKFEYSRDGQTWTALNNGSFGTAGKALAGDIRFDLNLPTTTNITVRALVGTTDGDQALTGAMDVSGSGRAVTVDLADFNWGNTGGSIGTPTTNSTPDPIQEPVVDATPDPIPDPDPVDPNFVAAIITFISDPNYANAMAQAIAVFRAADDQIVFNDPVPPAPTEKPAPTGTEPAGHQLVAAYNIGGGEFTSAETGIRYSADPGVTGGSINTRSIRTAISETVDDALYQSFGWGKFSYDIAVPADGVYTFRRIRKVEITH
ncbi:MAG TPA: malectin domain-containing carbohydrate-binding protein [Hyphomicrobiaceae bacterium]|nr:malectin domain-containing carbohydrate-binding protein [Hyphomicrobiaceae bacterium]